MKVDIIIPCYNSEQTIKKVVDLTTEVLEVENRFDFSFILVNDFSTDNTSVELDRIHDKYENVSIINLAKNAGQHNAILAGLSKSNGDYVLCMDDDMQTHPEEITKIYDALINENQDVMYGVYKVRKHSKFKNFGSGINNFVYNRFIGRPKNLRASSFWMCKAFVRDEIIKGESSYTNIQGLFYRTTSLVGNTYVTHHEREVGESNYTFKKSLKLWFSILNYTPVLVSFIFGTGLLLSFTGFVSYIIELIAFFSSKNTNGFWFISNLFLVVSGIQLIALSMIGEYITRSFAITSKSPQYVIKEYKEKKEN